MAINYDEATGNYTDGVTTLSRGESNAYEIGTLDQLKLFRDAVNAGNTFKEQTVKLTTSIDLNKEEWTPIGKNGAPFQGTFDGQKNTVSNLYINTPTQSDVGFFGFTTVGEIKNLTIENANVTGYLDVGAVAGTPYTSKYTNITLTGEVKVQGFAYVGGMFGKNVYANLTNLTIAAAEGSYVTADSVETDPVEGDVAYRTYVGGVIGFMGEGNTIVKNVTSNINVSGSTCDVGGITGIAHYGNSFVNVTCTADEVVLTDAEAGLEHEVGGIAGVWYNQANTTVQFINCNVENTTAVKSILNGVEQDVSSNITSGKSYNAETATSGSQLIGQNVVIEADGKYSAGEFTVSGPNAVNVLNGKLSDGLTVYPTADGVLSVDEAGYVAAIGDTRYTSFENAQAAVKPGETITILTDVDAENISMNGYGLASWNNSKLTATGNIIATTGDNVLSGNVASAQLKLEGSKAKKRTLTITESANVDLYTNGALDGGLLDIGKGLSDEVTTADRGERVYFAHAQIAGDVSVERYDDEGNASSGAIYIRPYSELEVTGNLDVVGEVHNRGSLVVDGGTMNMSVWATPKLLGYTTGDSMTVTNKGTMTVSGASAVTFGEASASLQHMEVVAQYADGMFATISAGGQFVADTLAFANDEDVTLTVTGEDSLFKLYTDGRTELSYYTYVQNEGKIIIADNAVFDVSGLANDNFVNTGTIDISSATATFATLTNDGTVNFKGGTEFNNTLTGNGTVVYTGEGNKITGGSISSKFFTVGQENPNAVLTTLEISGGAAVEVTGGGNSGRFAPQSHVVITGENTTFTTTNNVTMDETATLEISDGAVVSMGYLATGGKTDVTNATLNLTAASSSIGGLNDSTVFNVNDGGVVNAQAGLYIGHGKTKDGLVNVYKGGELNVSGGALYVSGLHPSYAEQGNGTLNIDGGKVTASNGGDFGLYVGDAWGGASGVLNVTNGGSLTAGFSVQFNATSVVTVDGGEITVNQLYQSEGGELSIVNGGRVTLTSGYFAMGGRITVGDADSGKTSSLTTVAGTEKRPASLGGDYTGHEGETVLNIEKNGEVVLGAGLIIGHRETKNATVNVNEGGRMLVTGGTLYVSGITPNYAVQGNGELNINGGTVEVTGDAGVEIGDKNGVATGVMNINGGDFTAQSVTNYGAVNVTGASTLDAEFMAAGTGLLNLNSVAFGSGTSVNDTASYTNNTIGSEIVMTGTNTLTDGAFVSTGWSKNFRLGYETGTESDSLEISGGATLKVGGVSYIGSDPEDKKAGAYQVTVSGAGSSFAGSGAGGDLYLRGDGQLTVKDDASASFSYADIKGSVVLENGNFSFINSRLIGTIAMDYASTLTFSGEINSAGGAITVDMTDYDDRGYKLIDYTGSDTYGAEDYKLLLGEANWNENYAVFENDLYLITTDTARIGVDDDWAGKTDGDIVAYGEEYFRFGTNAFANLTDAVGAAAEEATILVADGTYDESVVVSGNRNLEIGDIQITSLTLGTKDEAFTGSFTLDSLTPVNGSASDKNGRLVLLNGEFASSTDMSAGTIWLGNSDFDTPDAEALKGVSYTISAGTVSVDYGFYVGCANPDADDPNKNSLRRGYYTLTVTGTGSLDAPSANLNIRQDGVFNLIGKEASANLSQYHVYGEANISEGATLETSNLLIYNDDHKAEMTVKDSTVTVRSGLNVGYTKFRNGTLNLDNSVLNANVVNLGSYGDAGTSPLYPYPEGYEKAQLNLSNGAELKATGTFEIKDTGVLNLTDSTLTAANTITNNGTINVAGTSTVEAEIDGALDLLDGADVTFAGGANDLLVASGAEVTLRGELSGNEVVYEKGYKYNDDDARGITVNIASGEDTTFQSYAWYASNGSTYNVQSSAEITYANINATGTINVAEGATLTVGRESSNILGTLNVDGTINSVMTVYAGYTGGEYADGAQAGLVNITGTANSSIVTIGTAVRDNDKYNAAAAEGANTIASIVVNGGTFNVTGQEGELTSKLFVGSTEYAGTLSAVNGTINVGARSAAGTGYMRFLIGKKGALNLDNSTMTVYNLGGRNNSANGVFQNSGEINMDVDSQIITATVLANSGTITVDMTDATEFNVYKLIDYTGTGTVTNYGKVELDGKNDYGYVASVLNNDLYLVRKDGATEYYVNSEWSSSNLYDEVTFVDGTKAYYGLNAFDTVDHALTATSYENGIWLNVTGDIGAITVVGTDVTEVNASAKDQIDPETGTVAADAIVVNLVDINNTNAGWQVYYPLASGSNAQIYGDITTNFLSTTFTWGEKTADPNFIGGAYAGSTATVYGNTTVNLGAVDAADDTLQLDTSFLMGAGAGTVNGNSSVNINSGTVEADAIVGGAAWRGQVKGDSSVTISGGQITVNSAPDAPGFAIMGGSYGSIGYDPEAPGAPAATAGSSSVTITGDAVVTGKVIGGSDQTAVTNSSVEISGEAQVTGNVYGGGNRGGEVKETATVKLVDTATVDGNVYGGGFGTETAKSTVQGSTRVEVSGGTVTGNVYGGGENSSVGNTSVVVDGADVEAGIYGGSLNGDAGDTTVTISNFTRLQPVPGTQSDKIQIVGGGMAEAGKSSTTASTNVTVTDSKIYGDVVAGSSATGTGATAISGKSVVNVSNLEINGYSEGSNIWTGRVFGAGRAQNGGSVVTESTDVTIENMSGYTYDSEGHIIDGSNKGARVYGAGQAYASMSRVEVGETKLRISGDATNISEIYGGGIVSGTEVQEKAAFQIVGKTDVEITGGTVTDVIAGGNNTNWFGRTVIGVDAGDGTYQAAEGEYGIRLVIGGSTKVNEGALVTGGSYVDFAYEYQNIVDGVDTYGRTAEIYGNTYMELTGDSVISTDVFGGSFAYYEQVDFSADVSKLSAPSATQYGDVTVVVSGNTAIAGSVYGGGAAVTNSDQVKTTSVTNGDVSVLISGGTVSGNVYAGGYYADVNGNASVTLTGGTVGGDVYGGSEGTGTVGSSTLNVGATDAARYTTTLNNVYDFDVANITNAAVTVEGVFSATQISIADSTLTLNSGFDAATTTVSIEVGAYNAENAALVLGSAVGTAPAISISAGSNALTEARYLVATGFDDTTAFSLDESLTGEYILRAVDGNIYLYNADAPYFTTELSVTQAEGASVDGYYSFTANFEAAGLLTGYTLKLYDSATATTPVDEVTLDADAIGQEFTLENTTQSFWISVTANGENGLSTDSPTSGRLEVVVKDYDSPVIQSVSSNVASEAITLTCEATDNFGVTGYEFILDGQSLGVQTGSEIALDLSTLTAGTHSYTVNVYDAAGNLATSAEQSFDFTPGPGPEPGPTEPANFLYSSQVRMDNGETVSVYATYSDAAAALEYRIGDSGEWLTYDATTGVNVSSSTTVYFREQGITDPVETAVDVTVVPADVELNAEVILLAPTTDTTYEVIYNFADGGSKAVELSGNSVEHYALPENTTVTIVEKDASGEVVNTIVEETPAASTTAEIPDKVVAVDDGHDNLFFAMPVGQWGTGIAAQHLGDGTWGGTLEIVSLTGKNRFSTVFTGSDDATTLFLTDDANGDVFFLDDIYTANGSDARIRKMSEIQAGAGDDIVDLTSARFAYEEHASKQLTVRGGDGNDILWGNAGHNIMFGDDGNDRIYGGSDNDVLIGGTGNDTMLGGGGDDIFCYGSSFDWGSDTITQLSGGTVTLYLDGIDRNDCSISGSTLTWNDGTHTGSITLNGVSWDSVKFYCAANGDGDLTKQSDYEELKNKGAFAAISSH